jgi:hypothetical protein
MRKHQSMFTRLAAALLPMLVLAGSCRSAGPMSGWHIRSFELGAIPETFATAWTCLFRNLEITKGQLLVIRGATSSFGQSAAAGFDRRSFSRCPKTCRPAALLPYCCLWLA